MPDAVARFSGFADTYDRARPRPPAELTEVVTHWAGTSATAGRARPAVVDLGAGTGLSAALWSGRAARVVAVEPSADMRAVAERRLRELPDAEAFTVVDAVAEATGLPDGCADVVTASQALHWFDPDRALPEAARLLRPGGVFAAYDCDWPPCVDWETDAAFSAFNRVVMKLDASRKLRPASTDKEGHLGRMRRSGLFRHVTEVAVHSREEGDAERLLGVALSLGATVGLLRDGVSEDELGLTRLREVAARRLAVARPWWWTYRVRLGVV